MAGTQVMAQIDVLYMTRVQKERFPSPEAYDAVKDVFRITPETMAMVNRQTDRQREKQRK